MSKYSEILSKNPTSLSGEDVIGIIQDFEKRITELERANTVLRKLMLSGEKRGVAKATEDFKSKQAIRDLEQQAKGIEYFFNSVEPKISMGKSKVWELQTHNVNCYLDNLRKQAKQLKEQGK